MAEGKNMLKDGIEKFMDKENLEKNLDEIIQ